MKTRTKTKTVFSLFAFCCFTFWIHPVSSQTYIRDLSYNDNDPTGDKGVRSMITLKYQSKPDDNGKVIIVGDFQNYNGTARRNIARLNANGTLDASFNPVVVNGSINTVAEQRDGKLVIGGFFTTVNGLSLGGVARLDADGSLDAGFDMGGVGFNGHTSSTAPPEIYKILIKDDPGLDATDPGILVGGRYSYFNGVLFDGTIIRSDGDILKAISGLVQLNMDGSFNRSFKVWNDYPGGGINDMVFDMVGNIVIGGEFGRIDNKTKGLARIARLNRKGGFVKPDGLVVPLIDPTYKPEPNRYGPLSSVLTVAVQPDNKILVGGMFDHFITNGAVSYVGSGPYLTRLNADGTLDIPGDGDTDPDFQLAVGLGPSSTTDAAGFFNGVHAIIVDDKGRILVGGRFSGAPAGNLFRLNNDGSVDGEFNINAGFNGTVLDIMPYAIIYKDDNGEDVSDEGLLVAGTFKTFNNDPKQGNLVRLGRASVLASFLLELKATKSNTKEVKLQWSANSDVLSYELQRSADGHHFQAIATYSNIGSNKTIIYRDQQLKDQSALYYRVVAKVNGETHYSNVEKIAIATVQASLLPLSTTALQLTYTGNSMYGDKLFIQSIAADGRLTGQKQITVRSNTINTIITWPTTLSNGFLLLRDEAGAVLYKTFYITTSR